MLTELHVENFKCFGSEIILPVGRLNLLTGINAKGKSTTLQAILTAGQSISRDLSGVRLLDRVELNGQHVHLGTFGEVRHRGRPKNDPVRLGFEFSDPTGVTMTQLCLQQTEDGERWAGISKLEIESPLGEPVVIEPHLGTYLTLDFRDPAGPAQRSMLQTLSRMHYVSADRLGPQDFFARSDDSSFPTVGARGERTAEILYKANLHQQTIAEDDPRARSVGEESATLLLADQASAWLSHLFDGGQVRVAVPHVAILTLEMNADGSATKYYRPVNVGFGYSYSLPILVAGLVAQPGDILIVENPEAHLHPLAQSRLGEFLVTVSRAGVQVFVESHSEHVLNAFRLAVKEQCVAPEDLVVLYFRRHEVDPILRVGVQPDGSVPHWPDGFFDQRTHDFFRLFGHQVP